MKAVYFLLCIVGLSLVSLCSAQSNFSPNVANPLNAPDLPGFSANLKLVPKGSIIIPMDPSLQILEPNGGMSVLPYGLAIRSLWGNISVSWAITSGKAFGQADITAQTKASTWQQIASAGSAANAPTWSGWGATTNNVFYGGPLIILSKDVPKALTEWNKWFATPSAYLKTVDRSVYYTVKLHYLTVDTLIDIRHTLNNRPHIAVSNLDGNAATQTAILGCVYQQATRSCPREDGYGWGGLFGNGNPGCTAFQPQDHAGLDYGTHYESYDCGAQVAALTSTTCLTTFSEPHWEWNVTTGPSYITAMQSFIQSGANFFAQCASIQSYENKAGNNQNSPGTFLTRFGIRPAFPSNGINYYTDSRAQATFTNYPDLPVTQFTTKMNSYPPGNVPDFYNNLNTTQAANWQTPGSADQTAQGYTNFLPNAFPLVTNIYDSRSNFAGRNLMIAGGAKYNQNLVIGSNVWYLGGHTWAGVPYAGSDSGRRFFMNAILIPANRPASCGFTFCTAGEPCATPDACTTCACNSLGTGFVYAPIPGCCLNNTMCPASCTQCNVNSHACVSIPNCCSASVPCTQPCTNCSSNNVCAATPGCCTNDAGCNFNTRTNPCARCDTNSKGCITLPEPACCNPSVATSCSSNACMVCNSTSNSCVRQTNPSLANPLSACCLVDADCLSSGDACQACNKATHQCYPVAGCCNKALDCGTSPCLNCTSNQCARIADCCETTDQCGACLQCSSTSHTCVASSDASCCTVDTDCGSCRRCAPAGSGKTCVPISQCCLSDSDCEACQSCNNSSCTPIDACCQFDTDCAGCDICESFNCVTNHDLNCCIKDNDCELARTQMRNNGNSTNIPECDLVCTKSSTTSNTGVCKEVCSSPTSYTGLIVGLAAGVPLGLLCLALIAGALAAFLYMKKKSLSELMVKKGEMPNTASAQSPLYESNIPVHNSPL